MYARIPAIYGLLFPMALALGWGGTRTALHIRHTKGSLGDRLIMLVVGWCPLLAWLFALLVSFAERHP
jgi:hypothetical protein